MYAIKISYSWGDEEPLRGNYKTKEEAFFDACMMAAKEAYVQNEEFLEGRTANVCFNASDYVISLEYEYDGETCFYEIVDEDDSQA